jgi:hypothetical protein
MDLLQLEQICHRALELSPVERPEYLDRSCPSDEMRREVESLLQAQSVADNLFSACEAPEDFGETGRYQIVEKLGEGGMGVVFRAHQSEPVSRDVALKIIRPGMASAQLVSRFQRERQALAIMDHPYIARVHDAGATTRGLPYLVMELVSGSTIADFCDAQGLDRKQRATLMIAVCQAIQHAHQKGIIHRDIKASNVLVTIYDGKPVPKVIDFGIAKAVEGTTGDLAGETRAGVMVGTFEYISPEQAEPGLKDIDTRTDIYSLGALLYRLIAGRAPLQGLNLEDCTYTEILRRIREELPRPAGAGELDWVLNKALEKDRERRYQTADALALDLRRYVEGEPVEAAPPSAAYRLRKLAAKFKYAIAAGAAGLVLLLAALGWMAYALRQQTRANAIEQEALAINNFLQNDLLAQASPNNQSGRTAEADPDLKVRTALDRAANRIAGKFDRQPNVEAAIRYTIGRTYLDLGLYPQARKQLERALELERRVLGADNRKTLETMSRLGLIAVQQARYVEAEALLNQLLPIQRRILGPEHPETLNSMSNLASAYGKHGKYAESEALKRQTLEIRRRVLGPEHPDTLSSMNSLAVFYEGQDRYAEAEALCLQTLEIRRRVLGAEHPDTLISMNNLTVFYNDEGKYREAETLVLDTLAIKRRVLGPEHPETLVSTTNLFLAYLGQGKYREAEALGLQNLEIQRRVLGPEHPSTLRTLNNLGDAYSLEGKYAQAEALLNPILATRRRVLGPEHPHTLYTLSSLADMHLRQGKYALAEAYASQALAGRRHTLGPEHPDTMDTAVALASAYQAQGKFAESEPLARKAFETDSIKRPDSWQRFYAESLVGAGLAGEKRFAEAEPLLLAGYQGMAARQERMGVFNSYYPERAREAIVRLYQAWGKTDKASEFAKPQLASSSVR